MLTIAPQSTPPVTMTHPATASPLPRTSQPAFMLPSMDDLATGKPRAAGQTLAVAEEALGEQRVKEIDEQARQLEGVFMRMLMRRIQGSMGKTGFTESSQSQFLQGMAFDEMGNAMAGGKHQGIGLGRMIYEVLVRDESTKGFSLVDTRLNAPE